jgi:hypothetical protein
MKSIKFYTITLSIISLYFIIIQLSQSYAAPQIVSISGSISHGSTVIISGNSFGTKSPAAPLVWDDCSGTNLSNIWSRTLPSQAASNYNIQYHNNGFRNVNAPHNRVNRYIAGGHAQAGYNPWNASGGPNVMLGKDIAAGTESFYISYYLRLDPLWPPHNGESVASPNYKLGMFSNATGSSVATTNYCGYSNPSPEENKGYVGIRCDNMSCSANWACEGIYPQAYCIHSDPALGWVKMENIGVDINNATAGKFYFYQNYELAVIGENCDVYRNVTGNIKSLSIGYYWARCNSCNPVLGSNDAFRYFTDVYMDVTPARVVLANNANYSSATIFEPQIPTAWSNTSITCTVNLGRLPDQGTAYLFVFDSSNNRNATGFPVTIGGSPGDTIPPSPPTGLRITE